MDSVRFGKALGIGARAAAKALVSAADAAAAKPATQSPRQPAARPTTKSHSREVVQDVLSSSKGIREGSRRFGQAVWAPAARVSGVLWLEVTGVFFGLFAFTGGAYCWRQRGVLLTAGKNRQGYWVMVAMTIVFGYFCVSSFVRARQRGRK